METTYLRFATKHLQRDYFSVALSALLFSSIVLSSALVVWATPLAKATGYVHQERYIYCFVGILATDTLLALPLARLRLQRQASAFVQVKLLQVLLNGSLNVLFLYGIKHWEGLAQSLSALMPSVVSDPVYAIFLANLLANAISLVCFRRLFQGFRPCFSFRLLKPMLHYAWPLLLAGLAGMANEMLSRAVLRHWLPEELYPSYSTQAVVGAFGACYKLAIFMALGLQAFRYAINPFAFAHAQSPEAPRLFSYIMHSFVLVNCGILFSISVNLDLLGWLFLGKSAYRLALDMVPYLTLAYLLSGVCYNVAMGLKIVGATRTILMITLLGACLTLVLNRLLIPIWGYWGSVWAMNACYATMCLLAYFFAQKRYPIPYQVKSGLAYIALTMVLILFASKLSYASFVGNVVSNLSLTVLYWIWVGYRLWKRYERLRPSS